MPQKLSTELFTIGAPEIRSDRAPLTPGCLFFRQHLVPIGPFVPDSQLPPSLSDTLFTSYPLNRTTKAGMVLGG